MMASSSVDASNDEGTPIQVEGVEHQAVYPPIVQSVEKLGYVKDAEKRVGSRDIGRSIVIGGRCYYIFGDTFCVNELGQQCGVQSNSVARISEGDPLVTYLLSPKPKLADSQTDKELVDWFVPLDDEEKGIQSARLPNKERFRVCLRCYGGVVETHPGVGWLWYEKSVYRGEAEVQYCKSSQPLTPRWALRDLPCATSTFLKSCVNFAIFDRRGRRSTCLC